MPGKIVPAAFPFSNFLGNWGQVCASVSLWVKNPRAPENRPCTYYPVMVGTLVLWLFSGGGSTVPWGSFRVIVLVSFPCSWNSWLCLSLRPGLDTRCESGTRKAWSILALRVVWGRAICHASLQGEWSGWALTLGGHLEYLGAAVERQVGSSFLTFSRLWL